LPRGHLACPGAVVPLPAARIAARSLPSAVTVIVQK
jgi:hypothetical protein